MIDADSFINNMNGNFNVVSDFEKARIDLNKTENNISDLKRKIKEYKKYKEFRWLDILFLVSFCCDIIGITTQSFLPWLIWTFIHVGINIPRIILPKVKAYIIKPDLEEQLKDEKDKCKELKNLLKQYKQVEEKRKEMLENDKDYKKAKKSLLDKIDDLDKEELLAIRTIIDEYTTNKDIPSQVGNIAEFLAETQVGDIDIKDTSLYNKQRDNEANSKGKIYYISGQKLD
mgnify:CR=1 FL=1